MSFIKLALFQVRLYIKNTYFVNLVIIETTTMLLYEYLAHYVLQTYDGKEWLIAGVMGTWASCTTRFSEVPRYTTISIKYWGS